MAKTRAPRRRGVAPYDELVTVLTHPLVADINIEWTSDGITRNGEPFALADLPRTDSPSRDPLIPSVPATYSYRANDPVPNAALPRAPDQGREEGLRAVPSGGDGIRCPNRKCRKKLAEDLRGTLTITCRHCGHNVTIFRE